MGPGLIKQSRRKGEGEGEARTGTGNGEEVRGGDTHTCADFELQVGLRYFIEEVHTRSDGHILDALQLSVVSTCCIASPFTAYR